MLTQLLAVATALGGIGIGGWIADALKDRRDRKSRKTNDESIFVATAKDLLEPVHAESARRLERIQFLKGIVRQLAIYIDDLRDAHDSGTTLPVMDAELAAAVDEIEE